MSGPRPWLDRAFRAAVLLFSVWYAIGLVLLGTSWVPRRFAEATGVWGDMVFLLLAAAVTLLETARRCGVRPALRIGAIVLAIAAAAEMLGAITGYPFGHYRYTEALGPRLLGVMPLIIPFCWVTVVLNSFWIALHMVRARARARDATTDTFFLFFTTAGLAVLTDLNLEPVASLIKFYWIWFDPIATYYGVPGINFFGWFLVAFTMQAVFHRHVPPTAALSRPPWTSFWMLASINFLFALMNYRAGIYAPVFLALNGFGLIGIGMAARARPRSSR